MNLLAILLSVHSPALAGTAVLTGSRWQALVEEPEEAEEHPPGPFATSREVRLTPVDDGLRVEASWEILALEPGWFEGDLIGAGAWVEEVRWDGVMAVVSGEADGSTLTGWVERRARVELIGVVPGDPTRGAVPVSLLPAVRGVVRVDSAELVAEIDASERGVTPGSDGFLTGAGDLRVSLSQSIPPRTRSELVMGSVGVGLTFSEGEVRGRARLEWAVRQGSLDAVSFDASGTGADLEVSGPNVRAWRRSGDRVSVDLQSPVDDVLRLDLGWSAGLTGAVEEEVPLPRIRLDRTWRTETTLQLARDGEVEVVPDLSGWEATAASGLPAWGRGLVEGTPTATFQSASRSAGGAVDLYRFDPVSAPAVMIDVASYSLATTEEGRAILRAHYEVRNERAAHLRVVPPPDMRIVGARVAGETALPVTDGERGWLVPLLRSVETVEGLLTFPVEVTLLGADGADWERKEEREVALPVVDAPVAVARVTLHLPPGYTSQLESGEHDVVEAFTEGQGITYGFGLGDVDAAEADALFQEAVSAWMGNEFEVVRGNLALLEEMGARNENVARLQSNLDVLDGRYDQGGEVALERRVKEQARARAVEEEREQQAVKRRAREKLAAGDYAEAEEYYQQAISLGKGLGMLEQDESVEYKSDVEQLERELAQLKDEVDQARATLGYTETPQGQVAGAGGWDDSGVEWTNQPAAGPQAFRPTPSQATAPPDERIVIEMDGLEIQGELFGATGEWGYLPEEVGQLDIVAGTSSVSLSGAVAGVTGEETSGLAGLGMRGSGVGGGGSGYGAGVGYGAGAARTPSPEPVVVPEPEPPAEPMPDAAVVDLDEWEDEDGDGAYYSYDGGYYEDELDLAYDEPADVHHTSAEVQMSRSRPAIRFPSLGGGGAKKKKDKKAKKPPPAPPPRASGRDEPRRAGGRDADKRGESTRESDRTSIQIMSDSTEDGEVEVTAAALSVVIPSAGQAVRYQQLLLPADAAHTVLVSAKRPRRSEHR